MNQKFLAGVDIGGTKCAVTLARSTDGLPDIVDKVKFPTPSGPQAALAALVESLEELCGKYPDTPLGAIGISCGGPLDSRRGVVVCPPNLPGWIDIDAVTPFSSAFGVPAALCNDANAGALAEWLWGAGQGCDPMIFLTFGTGMGGGVIVNGDLMRGVCDLGGEVGHLRLTEDGPVGFGKAGSFEGWCSGGGIARQAQALTRIRIEAGDPPSFCPTLSDVDGIDARLVAEAARAGDPLAREVWQTTGRMLGRGLSLLIDSFNPECILIGSLYGRCRDLLEEPMREALSREAISMSLAACRIEPTGLGEQIGDYAALAVAARCRDQREDTMAKSCTKADSGA